MIILDLFSGIGGFSKGFLEAGYNIKKHYFSEINKHAIANYKYNFKNSDYVGSVKDVRGSDLERANVITFGSPCQDFSQAGNRAGLDGSRSSLILEAIRLVREIKPDVFIWENVKGAFSSNEGADFQAILTAFANIGDYRIEWQLLNTAWFLPQNRERIYLIGHLDGRSKPGVFPFREVDFRTNERAKQTANIRTLTVAGNSGGLHSGMTLIKSDLRGENQKLTIKENPKNANTITKRYYKDGKENLIQMGAIRGRNPENPKSRKPGLPTQQMVEVNENQRLVNTLTSVHKDNIVISNCVTPDAYLQTGKRKRDENGRAVLTSAHERRIRRLTENECEMLQGFPINWTELGDFDGEIKKISRTQRYKMCGNAVSVPVVTEIAKRLDLISIP